MEDLALPGVVGGLMGKRQGGIVVRVIITCTWSARRIGIHWIGLDLNALPGNNSKDLCIAAPLDREWSGDLVLWFLVFVFCFLVFGLWSLVFEVDRNIKRERERGN